MSDFNYEKAWIQIAKPAFEGLSKEQKEAHEKLCGIVSDLHQGRDLKIPLSDEMVETVKSLSCKDLAEVARASYYGGHWKPSGVSPLFNTFNGASWKVSNVIDQILRSRLKPEACIEIHEGIFKRIFSGGDYWVWEEFGLATEANMKKYKDFDVKFSRHSLQSNINILAADIGDLWPKVDTLDSTPEYIKFLEDKIRIKTKSPRDSQLSNISKLKEEKAKIQQEIDGFQWLYDHNVSDYNCICYSHSGVFTFGWRIVLNQEEVHVMNEALKEFPFEYELKTI